MQQSCKNGRAGGELLAAGCTCVSMKAVGGPHTQTLICVFISVLHGFIRSSFHDIFQKSKLQNGFSFLDFRCMRVTVIKTKTSSQRC